MSLILQNKHKSDFSLEDLISNEERLEDKNTIIKFNFIDYDSESIENNYNKIKLEFINKTYDINILKNNNSYNFYICFDENIEHIFIENDIKYFYVEKITLINEKNNSKSFNITIYLKEINTINIFIKNYQKTTFSYELLYEATNNNNLPKNINIDNYIFDDFDEFGDQFCKRLNIINILNDSLIKDININTKEISYKISYRIENKNKINKIIQKYENEKKLDKIELKDLSSLLNNIRINDENMNLLLKDYQNLNVDNFLTIKELYIKIVNNYKNYFKDPFIFNNNAKSYVNINNDFIEILKYFEIYEI